MPDSAGRLTVLQVLPDLHSGGVERGVLEVGRALVEAGHRSLVISAGGPLVQQLTAEGSRHLTVPIGVKSPTTLTHIRTLRQVVSRERVDILHARSRLPAWVSLLAWQTMPASRRPRLVTTVHGLHSVSQYSSVMTRGEAVIAVSRTVRDYIRENYPNCPDHRVTVIPRGVDPDEFPYGFAPPDGWGERFFADFPECRGKRFLTLAGRLTRLKGHHDFLRVLECTEADVHGLIVGGEDPLRVAYAAELRKAVADRGLSDRVTFTGHRVDVREILSVSDVVLSLSTKPESFGRSVLEALSLGRPVVGYDHGGVGEVLSDLFPEGRTPMSRPELAGECVNRVLRDRSVPGPVQGYELRTMLHKLLNLYVRLAACRDSRVAA